jgi:hypothetical protein
MKVSTPQWLLALETQGSTLPMVLYDVILIHAIFFSAMST